MRYFVIPLLLTAMLANAQYNIHGKIQSVDTVGIEFATVRLLTADSVFISGTTTDTHGVYNIDLVNKGSYLLQCSAMGYLPQQINIHVDKPTNSIPPIVLQTDAKQLSEVTVTGSRINRVDNHLLIIPDKMSVKHSFSSYELLNNLMLPGFDVNTHTGDVTLFGKNVTIYVDGIPSDYNTVRNLRSKDIEKIEYHDVPTGRYSKDYAAINFITRKYKFGGYANFDAQQCIGHLNGTYNGYAQIVRGNTQYHVTGGYSMWDMSRDVTNSEEEYMFPGNPVTRTNKNLGGRTKRNMEYGQIRINNSTQKRQFMVQASLTHNNSDKNREKLQTYSSPYDISERSNTYDENKYIAPSVTGFIFFNLPKNQWVQFYTQANYSRQKRNSLYSAADKQLPNGSEEDYMMFFASVGYGKSFKHNNSLFLTAQEIFINSSANYTGTYTAWQHLWNSLLWVGGSYRHQIKKVSLNANVGAMIANTHVHNGERSSDISPNATIEAVYRPTQQQQLRAAISLGYSNVPLSYLTDAEIQTDFMNSRRGNPDLKQSIHSYGYTLNYSIQFGKFNAASNFNYGWQDNSIFNYYLFDNDMLIQTFKNGKQYYFTGDMSLNWNACKAFRMSVNGIYNHKENKAFLIRKHDNFGGSLNAMYFWRDFSVNTSFHLPSESMNGWAIVKSPFKYSFDIGWNHKNWSIKAWITNPFNHIKEKYIMNVPELKQYSETRKSRSGMVRVTYTFDFGKKIQRTGVDRVNTSTGSAVL